MKKLILVCFILSNLITQSQTNRFLSDSTLLSYIKNLSKMIDDSSNYDSLYYLRSYFYYLYNDKVNSLNDINKAISLSPYKEAFYDQKGDIYDKYKIYDSAIAAYEKSLTLDPLNGDTYLWLIHCYVQLKNYQKAIYYLNMGMSPVVFNITDIKMVIQPLSEDIYVVADVFEKGYKKDTTQYNALYGAGEVFFLKNDFDSSLFYLNKYIEEAPEDSVKTEAYMFVANIYLEYDSIDTAKYYLLKIHERNEPLPKFLLAMIGKLDKSDPVYYYYQGGKYYSEDNYDSSIYYFERYLNEMPEDSIDVNVYTALVDSYLEKGDTANAKKYVNNVKLTDEQIKEAIKQLNSIDIIKSH